MSLLLSILWSILKTCLWLPCVWIIISSGLLAWQILSVLYWEAQFLSFLAMWRVQENCCWLTRDFFFSWWIILSVHWYWIQMQPWNDATFRQVFHSDWMHSFRLSARHSWFSQPLNCNDLLDILQLFMDILYGMTPDRHFNTIKAADLSWFPPWSLKRPEGKWSKVNTLLCVTIMHSLLKVVLKPEGFVPAKQMCVCMCGWLDKYIGAGCALHAH